MDVENVTKRKMKESGIRDSKGIHELTWIIADWTEDGVVELDRACLVAADRVAIQVAPVGTTKYQEHLDLRGGQGYTIVPTLEEAMNDLVANLKKYEVDTLAAHSVISQELPIIKDELEEYDLDFQFTNTLETQGGLAYLIDKVDGWFELYQETYDKEETPTGRNKMKVTSKEYWALNLESYYKTQEGKHNHIAKEDTEAIMEITDKATKAGGYQFLIVNAFNNKAVRSIRKIED